MNILLEANKSTRHPSANGPARPGALSKLRIWALKHRLFVFLTVVGAGLIGASTTGVLEQTIGNAKAYLGEQAMEAGLVLTNIDIAGAQHSTREDVLTALNLPQGTPILSIDIDHARATIEALPWVKSAALTRQLPDRLAVILAERQPFALWQLEGEIWLVDDEAVRITQDDLGSYASLPFIIGPGAPEAYPELREILNQDPLFARRISAAIRVGERRWDITFDTGARLRLPEQSLDYSPALAWQRFSKMERDHQLLSREVAIYDMRLPDRMIVSLTPEGRERIGDEEDGRST